MTFQSKKPSALSPAIPSRAASEAARMIEEAESGQDGFQDWTPEYRGHIARLVDLAINVYGRRS